MTRLDPTERAGLCLAAFFLIGGIVLIVDPVEGIVFHQTSITDSSPYYYPEFVSRKKARAYGVLATVMRVGTAALVLWKRE